MCLENPLWGASRIHGELLMLGFEVAQSTVSKYMTPGGRLPSQSWKTFLRNHADAIAAIDMCVVPTVTFDRLFAFMVVGHGRRQLLWLEVTRHPTAAWLARQITEAFPWASAPDYLVRDNDRACGHVFNVAGFWVTSLIRRRGEPASQNRANKERPDDGLAPLRVGGQGGRSSARVSRRQRELAFLRSCGKKLCGRKLPRTAQTNSFRFAYLLPTAVEVTSVSPSAAPNWIGIRILGSHVRARCGIDWIFLNHH
jgi:hypothetical protein